MKSLGVSSFDCLGVLDQSADVTFVSPTKTTTPKTTTPKKTLA